MDNSNVQDQKALATTSEPPKTAAFPFLRLPIELRTQVWKHYCPDLRKVPRLLEFIVQTFKYTNNAMPQFQSICLGWRLAGRTRSLRCVLAVHQQSREIARAVFPDKLSVNYCKDFLKTCDIPFHKQRDLAYLYGFKGDTLPPRRELVATTVGMLVKVPAPADASAASTFRRRLLEEWADASRHFTYRYATTFLQEFCASVVNLAYEFSRHEPFPYLLQELTLNFYPNLKNVFLHFDEADVENDFIPLKHRWCASEYSNHDYFFNDQSGRCLVRAYWPNLIQHADYAKSNLSPFSAPDLIPTLKDIACFFEIFNVQVWPMVVTDPSKFTAYLDNNDDDDDIWYGESSAGESCAEESCDEEMA